MRVGISAPGLLTIAIPAYSGARYIASAIEAALAQTYRPIEIFVVDNGSDDDTAAIATALLGPERVHRNLLPPSIGGNWNRCIELAAGEYINLAHQDDMMEPTFAEAVVDTFRRAPRVGLVHTRYAFMDEDSRPIPLGAHEPPIGPPDHRDDFVWPGRDYFAFLAARRIHPISCPTVVVRREAYERVGVYDERFRYALDFDMYLRILLAYDVGHVGRPLLRYRRHPAQQTSVLGKATRTLEQFQTQEIALLAGEAAGIDRATCRRLRYQVARRAARIARRRALEHPPLARWLLRCALRLTPRSLLNLDAVAALLRVAYRLSG